MNRINLFERKSMSVKTFKRLLMMMVAIMMALVTFTSCDEDEDPRDDPDEIENNGGVAGKRLKIFTENSAANGRISNQESTYNSDGTKKRVDHDDGAYQLFTHNSDGTIATMELYRNNSLHQRYIYSYDANKKPKKGEVTFHSPGEENYSITIDYIFQNGRKIRDEWNFSLGSVIFVVKYEHNYNSNGRRTSTTETHSSLGTRQLTRTYNSDGTLQKVTYPEGYNNSGGRTITYEFTWEDGKTTINEDDFNPY